MELQSDLSEDNRPATLASNGAAADIPRTPPSIREAERYCRHLALSHYENFLVASVFLPSRIRQPFYNVYAYCRHADDLADESESPAQARESLHAWRDQLHECFCGRATHPIFVALRTTIERFDLQIKPFDDLLNAFLRDQQQTRYATRGELLDYCKYSADPVGRIVLRLADSDQDKNGQWSDAICTGLQLANHWQDVARDFLKGRIYLPATSAVQHQVDLENLMAESQRDRVIGLIKDECQWAREKLNEGKPLVDHVPRWLACDIQLFIHGGLATLDAIERVGFDVLKTRPIVTRWRQFRLVTAAALGRLR